MAIINRGGVMPENNKMHPVDVFFLGGGLIPVLSMFFMRIWGVTFSPEILKFHLWVLLTMLIMWVVLRIGMVLVHTIQQRGWLCRQ